MREERPRGVVRVWALLPAAVFLLFTMTLRAPITAVPPLVGRIGDDLGLGPTALGLLTSIPVLCFGLFTPVASAWLRQVGVNSGALGALGLIAVGSLARSAGEVWTAFAGTALIGAGLTIGNLAAPMVIGRDFRRRAPLMAGLYTATVNVVVTGSTALAVPLALVIGWQGSAAAWGLVPAVVAALAWVCVFPPGSRTARTSVLRRGGMHTGTESDLCMDTPTAGTSILRWPIAWVMAAAFSGHTFSYYALSSWLPTALGQMRAMDESAAGVAASVFQLTGIIGPMLVPVMFGVLHWSTRRTLGVICVCWSVLPLGLVLAPGAWLVWCVVSGFAQGAFFTALFTIVIQRTRTVDENRQLTALVQTVGYCVAALGPVVMGALHEMVQGWTLPLLVVSGALVVMFVCSMVLASDTSEPPPAAVRHVDGPAAVGDGDDPRAAGTGPGKVVGDDEVGRR